MKKSSHEKLVSYHAACIGSNAGMGLLRTSATPAKSAELDTVSGDGTEKKGLALRLEDASVRAGVGVRDMGQLMGSGEGEREAE